MKKSIAIFSIIACLTLSVVPCFAVNIGTYQTETEYGLLDGLKINWKRKELKYYNEDEYYRTKYMYEGKSII